MKPKVRLVIDNLMLMKFNLAKTIPSHFTRPAALSASTSTYYPALQRNFFGPLLNYNFNFRRGAQKGNKIPYLIPSSQEFIMSEATPRITAPYLEQFSHKTVRIIGKVRQLRGEQATIDAGGQINVFLNRVRSYLISSSPRVLHICLVLLC